MSEKIKVYEFTSETYCKLIVDNVPTVLELIKCDLEELAENDDPLVFEISMKTMSKKTFNNLPEWEG